MQSVFFIRWGNVAYFISISCIFFMAWLHTLPLAQQTTIALVAILVAGLPHGAFDYAHYRFVHPEAGRCHRAIWLLCYVGLTLAIVGVWWWLPTPIFALLLGFAAWHFGVEDGLPSGAGWQRVLDRVSRGALVIGMPVAIYPEHMAFLYGLFIAPPDRDMLLPLFLQAQQLLQLSLFLLLAGAFAVHMMAQSGRALELVTLTVLFVLVPPLIAFTLYFCLWHSVQHYAEQWVWLRTASPAFRAYTGVSVALCSLLVIVTVIVILLRWPGEVLHIKGIITTFLVLLAITVPHHFAGRMMK